MSLRILGLEPFFGGSHRAFLEGWIAGSRHRWTLLSLPPHHWKWRMRHCALTFARQTEELLRDGEGPWDLVFATDMVDLAQFRGLAPPPVGTLPAVAYFHENQLTYPVRREEPRDLHFAFTNFSTALAAREVWFNSEFHRETFMAALAELFRRLPEPRPSAQLEELHGRARIFPQGIEPFPLREPRRPGPLHLLWAARWEHDKNPADLFAALERVEERGVEFRLSVLGERYREIPQALQQGRERFRQRIDHWGFLPGKEDYRRALLAADVFLSTAVHEFFGVSAAEALAAGTFPLLPRRLAYPELLAALPPDLAARHLYDGTPGDLAFRIEALAGDLAAEGRMPDPDPLRQASQRFLWPHLRPRLDDALEAVRG
ncbi:MAG: DUF3524 domain-containing protein [Acidobacteria bacterium]|nr:DUF3524 domain-containing protein [Acidobacteriota bacterium]